MQVLSRRALGRATLARQMLLERHSMPAVAAVEALAGMQAQAPLSPYVGLWTRLHGFRARELADAMRERAVVRATLMRVTIHLVSARDALAWRPVLQRVCDGGWRGSQWSKQIGTARGEDVVAAAGELLDGHALGRTALGEQLAGRFPDADPFALGGTVLYLLPTVQPTPRGVWGEGGVATLTSMASWLGRPLDASPHAVDDGVEDLVLRCLAAFGPCTVMDIQAWSRLTRLREVVERLSDRLIRLSGEEGAELYDLPEAPRPGPDVEAPVRYLPEYDNLLLAHADRTRVNAQRRPVPLFPGNGAQRGTLLVDGEHAGLWRIHRDGGRRRLVVEPFGRLTRADRSAVGDEGRQLVEFAAPGPDEADVVIQPA